MSNAVTRFRFRVLFQTHEGDPRKHTKPQKQNLFQRWWWVSLKKWHGRPARGITRKMRVPLQTDPLPGNALTGLVVPPPDGGGTDSISRETDLDSEGPLSMSQVITNAPAWTIPGFLEARENR